MNKEQEPAFPYNGTALGITKREYFAAMAMQGLVSSSPSVEKLCEVSIKVADELLKQLES